MPDPFDQPVNRLLATIQRLRPILVKKMAAVALEFIHENFDKQGFQGATFQPWKKREDPKDQSRPLLIGKGSGLLKRSPFTSYSDSEIAIITSSLPYSKIHNEGGDIQHASREGYMHFDHMPDKGLWRIGKTRTVKQIAKIKGSIPVTFGAHTTHMHKRQYMGTSPVLTARIKEMVLKEAGAAFKVLSQ